VKQTAPLEQTVNTASCASLSQLRDDFNLQQRPSDSTISEAT